MRRLLGLAGALALALGLLVPAALAAEPLGHTGRVLISTDGDVSIPAGDHADVVVVVDGNADIRGEVNTLVVVDGTADLQGATLETVVAVGSEVEVGDGTVISGEIQRLDSVVHQTGSVQIAGGIVDLGSRLLQFGGAFAAVLALLWLGFGLANIVAGLLVAGLAGRQLRATEALISREPALAALAGLVGVILIPVAAILLFPTVVLAPLGFGILVVALPLATFGGYLVAAAWVGDWLLRVLGSREERERPYLPVVLGVVALGVLGLVPVLGLVVAIATLFGFGALIVSGIRTITAGPRPATGTSQPVPPVPVPTGA
jgi:hypothetical protein